VLTQNTIRNIFETEYQWIKDHRWWLAENNHANMLLLLDSDHMSLHHLNQVRNWMKEEEASEGQSRGGLKVSCR
jgi:hypothetical protein